MTTGVLESLGRPVAGPAGPLVFPVITGALLTCDVWLLAVVEVDRCVDCCVCCVCVVCLGVGVSVFPLPCAETVAEKRPRRATVESRSECLSETRELGPIFLINCASRRATACRCVGVYDAGIFQGRWRTNNAYGPSRGSLSRRGFAGVASGKKANAAIDGEGGEESVDKVRKQPSIGLANRSIAT